MTLPEHIIKKSIDYLPFIFFRNITLWNKHYRKYYQQKYLTHFPFLNDYSEYIPTINYINTNLKLENIIIIINIIDLARVIKKLETIYTIFFQNDENLSKNKADLFIKPYIIDYSKYLTKSMGVGIELTDNDKKMLKYPLSKLPYLDSNSILKIQYLVINNCPYYIKGWSKYLANDLKNAYSYTKFKKIINWLIIMLKEHITKFIFIEDLDTYGKMKIIKKRHHFGPPRKYIYCSGSTKHNRSCKNRIYFSRFYQEGLSRWYCYLHQPPKNILLHPSILNFIDQNKHTN